MPKYVFAYHGGSMEPSPEAQEQAMAAWGAWFGTLGDAVADIGNPFGASTTVAADGATSEGAGSDPVTGYSAVTAGSLEEAAALAKGCPVLEGGGRVAVYEAVEM
jgi:hypothetical protein